MAGNYIAQDPFLSLPSTTAATTDTSYGLDNGQPKASHSLFVVTSTGVSAGVVKLQGSNDNVNWFTTACSVSTAAASTAYAANLADFPFRYVRAAVTTNITGGTVTAYVASC